jgi:hypothetical protein
MDVRSGQAITNAPQDTCCQSKSREMKIVRARPNLFETYAAGDRERCID